MAELNPRQRKDYYVYKLVDSRNNQIFYIGKGSGKRMYAHLQNYLNGAKNENPRKLARISEIVCSGGKVIPQVISEHLSESEAFHQEKELIKSVGRHNLTNISPGRISSQERAMCFLKRIIPFDTWKSLARPSDGDIKIYWFVVSRFRQLAGLPYA